MRLYLVRHPPPLVAANTCYGSTDLAVAAEEQARALQSLSALLPRKCPLFSSPLQRCAGLAQDLAETLACAPVRYDARLAEMHFGKWEMCAWDAIARSEIDAWADDMAGYRPGGGENLLQMAQRVCAFYDDLRQSRHKRAIVVCHAGTIRLLLACQLGLCLADAALHAARTPHSIGYGELLVVDA
ncbi:histidine phosphatase family protein [Paraherbaspirillum soli]|uniref:Histidine phosphatase family protein n=1 Tax=Paraherbaspirillum soli TaxID=631222 RepID=A0ABW0M9C9_9BURK